MSVITLQYGQSGNNIGDSLYSLIYEDINNHKTKTDPYNTQLLHEWFHVNKTNKWEPRSILIDTEYKTMRQKTAMPFKFKNIAAKNCGGSANNWAFGYYEQSKQLSHDVMDSVRGEVEKCDFLSSFLNIFATAGGTGSGVGSRIIEMLRDEYPNKMIINVIVFPYTNGEIVIQSYNTLLALSKIYSISDCSVFFENDRLHYHCLNALGLSNVSFKDINTLLTQQLLALYQPVKDAHAAHLLAGLCAHPSYKFVQLSSSLGAHLDGVAWSPLLSCVLRQSARFDYRHQDQHRFRIKPKMVANALVCRGVVPPVEQDLRLFRESVSGVNWLPKCEAFRYYFQGKQFLSFDRFAVVAANCNNVCVPLELTLQDARNLFRYGAYVHHYKQFGVDAGDFGDCFDCVQKVLDDYKKL